MINVYDPQHDSSAIFNEYLCHINGICYSHIIVAGDFNEMLDPELYRNTPTCKRH